MKRTLDVGLVAAILALVLPFVITYTIDPEWWGRMIAVVLFGLVCEGVLVWSCFDERIYALKRDSVGERLYGRLAMKRVEIALRVTMLAVAVAIFPFFLFDSIKDILFLVKNRQPLVMTGHINETSQSQWNLGGIFTQTIWLKEYPGESWTIPFHYPSLHSGDAEYQFLHVPHSMQILEVREIHGTTSSDIGS